MSRAHADPDLLLCREFALDDFASDPRLISDNSRVLAGDWLLPIVRQRFATCTTRELTQRFKALGLPYATITRPQDLFDDPHLLGPGGLAPVSIPADAGGAGRHINIRTPLLPLTLQGQGLPLRQGPPALGEHNEALLLSFDSSPAEVARLRADKVVGQAPADS
jgi:crotonobetainyl-CoA:carnitine CoA-transferase CaiB-like acyl-CoA transferase